MDSVLAVDEWDAHIEQLDRLYIYTTPDEKSLPLFVAESVKELSEMVGVSVNSIHSSMSHKDKGKLKTCRFERVEYNGYKHQGKPHKLSEAEAKKAAEMHEEGMTVKELQEVFHVSYGALYNGLRRYGLTTHCKPGRRSKKRA